MTIKIIEDGPDIFLTRSEEQHLRREWEKCCQYTVDPPTFEEFVRSRVESKKRRTALPIDF